jgi:HemX protein
MPMVTKSWLYDLIIYIYALSLLFYFTDAVSRNDGAKRMGAGLLVFVWILQTLFFCFRMYEHRYIPVLTMFEALFFFAWLLVTISLVLSRFFSMAFAVFFVNVFAFTVLVLNLLTDPGVPPAEFESTEKLLWLHIALAIFSYAAFAMSAVLSGLYLFLHRRLKGKRWSFVLIRLPSLETLEKYMTLFALVAIPMLILSLSLGSVAMVLRGTSAAGLFMDIKVAGTLAVLVLYGWIFVLKRKLRSPAARIAWWNVASFAVLMINFAFSNFFSMIHPWPLSG